MAHEKEEPGIIGFGRMHVKDYTEEDYHTALKKVFRTNKSPCVSLDSNPRGQKFQAAGIAWALDKGFLYNDDNIDEGQTLISIFRLTEAGRKEFLS